MKIRMATMTMIAGAVLTATLLAQDPAREQKLQQAIDLIESKGDVAHAMPLLEDAANKPDSGSIYTVYTSIEGGVPNDKCAYHTWGSCGSGRNAVPIQVAAVPYASGVAGTACSGVQDTATGHSLALAQIANMTMHETIEAITDPRGTGYRDANGDEIADKCIRIFPADLSSDLVFSNGSVWKLLGMWSNAAYVAGSGTPNSLGQPACIW